LIAIDAWSKAQHEALTAEVTQEVRVASNAADAIGTLGTSRPPLTAMFEDVFGEPDARLARQRHALGL
jgi:2-oxoisovalerate dehydrogenase E1 component alpha subunit